MKKTRKRYLVRVAYFFPRISKLIRREIDDKTTEAFHHRIFYKERWVD